ncbi:hypothetical protein TIFTF001_000159 [Ficus carica]|uniref:Uncharacterized protein n=1 Tax=Ficus carica TaxID=3494 RepID=A0AA87Z8N6_FICCA|nr:hypothetical protein TIFTF001_000159 [Ficus carica]
MPPLQTPPEGGTVLGKSDPVALTAGGNGIGFQFPEFAPIIWKKQKQKQKQKSGHFGKSQVALFPCPAAVDYERCKCCPASSLPGAACCGRCQCQCQCQCLLLLSFLLTLIIPPLSCLRPCSAVKL